VDCPASRLRRWIWGLVTGGDPAVAPMVRTQSKTGRTCTGGVKDILSTLARRCPDEHVAIVRDYAATVTARIEECAAARPTSDSAA
jgi:hypothetical protein